MGEVDVRPLCGRQVNFFVRLRLQIFSPLRTTFSLLEPPSVQLIRAMDSVVLVMYRGRR